VFWGAAWGDGIGGALVTRTNPKTVTLDRRSYPRTLPYEQIKSVECPHEGTEIKITIPRKAKAEPDGGNGTAERLAELKDRGQDAKAEPLYVDARTEYFPTPPAVVQRMIGAADLEPGMTVLEPSAGTGAIAGPVHALGCNVDCVELSADLARVLDNACYRQVIRADFLEYGPRDNPAGAEYYDRVLMNPPFSRQADIAHVRHALGFVKPGGLLVAIMSAGVEFRQDKTAEGFRKLVAGCGGRIERLPDDSFEKSGTSVRTVMVTIPVS
jgi:predicted RNA methylase